MSLIGFFRFLRCSLQQLESKLIQTAGFNDKLGPALAVNGPSLLPHPQQIRDGESSEPSFLDSIFWMAAPKKRRTIETNIEPCPECGNLKQKNILCGFCYEKVQKETAMIRKQIELMEGRPHNAPTMETVVLYENEVPREVDKEKRIVERSRKRPSWFNL
ncbi:39S ribosomal protein L32, mitochondrial [Silurus meridionalis]|nr:39S ribosomal protein L32, mitochondrial [Silurus meridionalis]